MSRSAERGGAWFSLRLVCRGCDTIGGATPMDKPSKDQPDLNERAPTPVMEYASVPKLNPAARRSLWMGLLLFVPFIGIFAVREAKWGRKTAEMTGTGRRV